MVTPTSFCAPPALFTRLLLGEACNKYSITKENIMAIENEVAEQSQFANIPPSYTSPSAGVILPNAGHVPEPTAEQIAASKDARIAELEAALAAHAKQAHKNPVELPGGEQLTAKQATTELERMSLDAQLEILKSRRFIEELAAQTRATQPPPMISSSAPVLNRDSAEALMGKDRWQKLPTSAKASGLDIRPGDLDRLSPEAHFGPNSSRAAHDLSKANPVMYELLRERAVQKGIIAARGQAPAPKSNMRAFSV